MAVIFGRQSRSIMLLCLMMFLAAGSASAQTTMDKRKQSRRSSVFNLNAGPNSILQANLIQCGITNEGEVCSDVFDSPTGGGGFWPSGTANQYIYNSGLQLAGINSAAAGPWSRDTVGAYFFDARGTQAHGSALTDVYSSLNPADLANWPAGGIITDTSIFNSALIGSKVISDQDSYVEYWDGDPNRISGRTHPMGIKVQQRSLAFNAPAGAEHTIFFIYRFTNVTNDPTFQQLNEGRFNVQLPDAGWQIDSIYAAFAMDPDVTTTSGANFSTALLPLNMGMAYHATFTANDFNFAARADLYAPPFFQGPGFVGVKYLRSPAGLSMFSNTTNDDAFPDPRGVRQLFRYLKGDLDQNESDPVCTVPNSIEERLCALVQSQADTRFFQASGPFTLRPGESATIVVGYTHGAPVRVAGYTPGQLVQPGIPSRLPGVGTDSLRLIERIGGLIQIPQDAVVGEAGNQRIDETRLAPGRDFVPRSLVHNALIAQTIFNNKFLLPRPPEAPEFSLVPGDQQVTVVWAPSATETCTATAGGDPYFTIASDESSALYNPNYRRCDVEGYRIYRAAGLSGGFELIAQFDKTGTSLHDVTCELDPAFVPEENEECEAQDVSLNGDVVQFFDGGRVRNAVTGSVQLLPNGADTVSLSDTGVPFAFIDRSVRNGITYRYAVTAFDVNSLRSGAASLESARQPAFITPRKDPNNLAMAAFNASMTGDNATSLDPEAAMPDIDANAGTFSGPMPPTNGLIPAFSPLVNRLLPAFSLKVTVDSVVAIPDAHEGDCPAGSNWQSMCWKGYVTLEKDGQQTKSVVDGWSPMWSQFDAEVTEWPLFETIVAPEAAGVTQFGLPENFPGFTATTQAAFSENIYYSSLEGQYGRRFGACNTVDGSQEDACTTRIQGGSRWFSGANETVADPTTWTRHGRLTGVDTIASVMNHIPAAPGGTIPPSSTAIQSFYYATSAYTRAADVQITWGANGTITSVRDVSHNVSVPFSANTRASWGFMREDANGNGMIDWDDFNYLDTPKSLCAVNAFCLATNGGTVEGGEATAHLVNTAVIGPISMAPVRVPNLESTGDGIALYINGEKYFFKMAALPAAGTVWTLRTYAGQVRSTATLNPLDASGYRFVPLTYRQAWIPGLRVSMNADAPTKLVGETDITNVHTVPDPYYVRSAFGLGPSNKSLRFVNLPTQAIIRIFSLNGTLVRILEHNDPQGGAETSWDLRNRNNQYVASGVYFFVVEAADGRRHTGKFTVVQFAR